MNALFNRLRQHDGWRIFGIAMLLMCCPPLWAAQAPLAHFYQDHWSTRDGLPHNSINAMAQTEEGYLWFASWEGVSRYNGQAFRVFSRGEETGLPDSGIRSLVSDGQGLLVAGARGGLSRYQHQGWAPQPDAPAMINHVLRDRNDRLWLATQDDGIYVRDGELTVAHYGEEDGLPGAGVYRLLQDDSGRIWAGTAQGLVWIDEGQIHPVSSVPAVPVLALLRDNRGRVLIGSERGMYVAEPATESSGKQPEVRTLYPELAGESISSLLQDDAGDLWLGTIDRGLIRISRFGMERMGLAEGLPDQRVVSLLQDAEHSIWVGTNGGLMRLRDAPFSSYTEQDGLVGDYVRTVLAHSDGSLWVGTSNGLGHIREQQIGTLPLTMPGGLAPSVLSLAEGNTGELWVGTYTHGLLRLMNGDMTARYEREQGLAANEVRAILPASDGRLWVGTSEGLSLFEQGRFRTFTQQDGLPGSFVMNLFEASNGDIWVGTGVGAAIVRQGRIIPVYLNSQDNAEYAFGFYQDPEDDRYVWLATDRGLLRYRYADGSLASVGKKHGLPIEKMFQPVVDHLGGMWLTTNRGVIRISLAQAHQVADGTRSKIDFELFGEGDGMVSSQANGGSGPAATLANDGSVWIATARGVARTQPRRLVEFSDNELPVVLESLEVNGKVVDFQESLSLAPGSNRLLLHFAGLGFVTPERIQYRTLLQGFDQDWVERGRQHLAEYTNLPPGDYVFRVTAAYPYDDWSEQEASLTLTIAPFVWQRPLFWVGVGSLALLGLWLLMRLRVRLLKSRAVELQRQVAEKTDELRRQALAFERQAREDKLTGLPNRRAFDEALFDALARARRSGQPLSLAIVDIDHFKRVNDTWSHAVGDEAIKLIADILQQQLRVTDTPARWGGEEFTLLLPDTDAADAFTLCERVRLAIAECDCRHIAPGLSLTVSMGLVQADLFAEEKLLSQADKALYQAKNQGRNQVVVFQHKSIKA
ncbi:ligand-binding sensor domain-containing diguanylate cyclase [Oceanisphaera sediminis]